MTLKNLKSTKSGHPIAQLLEMHKLSLTFFPRSVDAFSFHQKMDPVLASSFLDLAEIAEISSES